MNTKLKLKQVKIGFSENPQICKEGGRIWKGEDALKRATSFCMSAKRPSLGYDKTDVTIFWEDEQGEEFSYKMRFDYNDKNPSLEGDLLSTMWFYAGKKPAWMEQENYDSIMSYSQNLKEFAQMVLTGYYEQELPVLV